MHKVILIDTMEDGAIGVAPIGRMLFRSMLEGVIDYMIRITHTYSSSLLPVLISPGLITIQRATAYFSSPTFVLHTEPTMVGFAANGRKYGMTGGG